MRPWLFVNDCSRLTIDPERFPDEPEEMRAVGMGAVCTATSRRGVLRESEPAELIDRYFTPYADALAVLSTSRSREPMSRRSATDAMTGCRR